MIIIFQIVIFIFRYEALLFKFLHFQNNCSYSDFLSFSCEFDGVW